MRTTLPLLALLLTACTGADKSDTAGDTAGDTAACVLAPPSDRLRLAAVCVDGLCAPQTYAGAVAALGEPTSCATVGVDLTCRWPSGLSIGFIDSDGDGVADTDRDTFAQRFVVEAPYDGASEEGLALGVAEPCVAQLFGPPLSTYEVPTWRLDGGRPEDTLLRYEASGGVLTRLEIEWATSE